ncbi:D-glycerate dehydrogenase [Notoacmeibacter sp. MSK16QG-6]|uniref:2-hydroxyacid dehydrogenase n=1 Tax=Notoacmeibacter sp. MSK16QG-6 TaxID=2957982 RepID=UPI00209D52A8|nr:D-glycerate dehydrogenase [Notoacmeibacter sp. MSK16QG-6]MCP1198781.1 D-glycerate dehydrogenase [Notoacmeibacter sp. MSK16QG-6]
MTKPRVVLTRKLPVPVEQRMGELFDLVPNPDDQSLPQEALFEAVKTADVLVPTLTDRIDADLIRAAGDQLRMIANFGAGTEHIDVEAANRAGIIVTNTPGVLTEDTADMTMALIVAVPRRLVEGSQALLQMNGEWNGWSPNWMLGRRIFGKKLGIVGMGRIGTAVARRAKAFGLSIHYHNRAPVADQTQAELNATYWDDLDDMLARMDIVTIHTPLTPETRHMIDARRLALLKREAYFVNVSRGGIVDEAALIDAVEDRRIAGAALDVFNKVPNVNPRLLELCRQNRITLLPHMGSATLESRIEMGERVLINIRVVFDGHRPPDRVLPARR